MAGEVLALEPPADAEEDSTAPGSPSQRPRGPAPPPEAAQQQQGAEALAGFEEAPGSGGDRSPPSLQGDSAPVPTPPVAFELDTPPGCEASPPTGDEEEATAGPASAVLEAEVEPLQQASSEGDEGSEEDAASDAATSALEAEAEPLKEASGKSEDGSPQPVAGEVDEGPPQHSGVQVEELPPHPSSVEVEEVVEGSPEHCIVEGGGGRSHGRELARGFANAAQTLQHHLLMCLKLVGLLLERYLERRQDPRPGGNAEAGAARQQALLEAPGLPWQPPESCDLPGLPDELDRDGRDVLLVTAMLDASLRGALGTVEAAQGRCIGEHPDAARCRQDEFTSFDGTLTTVYEDEDAESKRQRLEMPREMHVSEEAYEQLLAEYHRLQEASAALERQREEGAARVQELEELRRSLRAEVRQREADKPPPEPRGTPVHVEELGIEAERRGGGAQAALVASDAALEGLAARLLQLRQEAEKHRLRAAAAKLQGEEAAAAEADWERCRGRLRELLELPRDGSPVQGLQALMAEVVELREQKQRRRSSSADGCCRSDGGGGGGQAATSAGLRLRARGSAGLGQSRSAASLRGSPSRAGLAGLAHTPSSSGVALSWRSPGRQPRSRSCSADRASDAWQGEGGDGASSCSSGGDLDSAQTTRSLHPRDTARGHYERGPQTDVAGAHAPTARARPGGAGAAGAARCGPRRAVLAPQRTQSVVPVSTAPAAGVVFPPRFPLRRSASAALVQPSRSASRAADEPERRRRPEPLPPPALDEGALPGGAGGQRWQDEADRQPAPEPLPDGAASSLVLQQQQQQQRLDGKGAGGDALAGSVSTAEPSTAGSSSSSASASQRPSRPPTAAAEPPSSLAAAACAVFATSAAGTRLSQRVPVSWGGSLEAAGGHRAPPPPPPQQLRPGR